MSDKPTRAMRIFEVEQRVGISRASLYRLAREGKFPGPIRLGGNSSAWLEHEVDAWLASRIADRDAKAVAA